MNNRIQSVDYLRGVAALCVCLCHITQGSSRFLGTNVFEQICQYGKYGVQVFFVISGFIIPYALFKANYNVRCYPRFCLKRIIRLDPPYLATIGVILLMGYVSNLTPGYQGAPFAPSLIQVALHLGYANVFFGYSWLSSVFWTLAIEFQYYLLVGLLYPLIISPQSRASFLVAIIFILIGFVVVPSEAFIFRYASLFLTGMIAFQFSVGLISNGKFLFCALMLLFLVGYASLIETPAQKLARSISYHGK